MTRRTAGQASRTRPPGRACRPAASSRSSRRTPRRQCRSSTWPPRRASTARAISSGEMPGGVGEADAAHVHDQARAAGLPLGLQGLLDDGLQQRRGGDVELAVEADDAPWRPSGRTSTARVDCALRTGAAPSVAADPVRETGRITREWAMSTRSSTTYAPLPGPPAWPRRVLGDSRDGTELHPDRRGRAWARWAPASSRCSPARACRSWASSRPRRPSSGAAATCATPPTGRSRRGKLSEDDRDALVGRVTLHAPRWRTSPTSTW